MRWGVSILAVLVYLVDLDRELKHGGAKQVQAKSR